LAAYHHPDLVAKNPRVAWDTNVTALSRFLNTVENVKCLYYPSSDSVYGESYDQHRFVETDPLKPVNRYGQQKCVAETLVTAYGYNVVRFPFLIAPSLIPGKKHFYDVIAETIQRGETMEMFADSYRSALSFDTAAELTVRMMESYCEAYPKVLNVCGDDDLSKYDIGLMIADKLGVSRDLIKPISIESTSGIFEAKRASSTLMDNTLLKHTLGLQQVKLVL
jgi:dTDP-4-dehydrorhamnose reductase